jgi:hypothetical protein
VSRFQRFALSSVSRAFGSLACFDSELVSPRLLKGSLDGFCELEPPFVPSDLRAEGRAIDAVSIRVFVGLGVGCWFCSDVVDADGRRPSGPPLSFLCLPVTRSNRDRFGSRPLGDRCAMLFSRLCALCTLGEGLVARLRKFSAELIAVEPDRIAFGACSRLVEALRGMPNPPDCFSSWLRLCLCPGKCNLWPAMEGLCKRLLLCSVCGVWLLFCASFQNVSDQSPSEHNNLASLPILT